MYHSNTTPRSWEWGVVAIIRAVPPLRNLATDEHSVDMECILDAWLDVRVQHSIRLAVSLCDAEVTVSFSHSLIDVDTGIQITPSQRAMRGGSVDYGIG